jgi:hypothetical protein
MENLEKNNAVVKEQQVKTILDLTPEIEAQIPIWKDRAIKDLYNGVEYKNWKKEDTVSFVKYCYKLAEETPPLVIVANTIKEYKTFYNLVFTENNYCDDLIQDLIARNDNDYNIEEKLRELAQTVNLKNEQVNTHYIFLMSEYSRVYLMWYKFIQDNFNIEHDQKEILDYLYENVNKANIAKGYFCEGIALILRMPSVIKRNEIGFHSTDNEGAIQYPDMKMHYINGREMPDWIFDKYFSKTLTFDDFMKEQNEDIKAGIIVLIQENEGNEGLLNFLNAELIDESTLVHKSGHMETIRLYKSKEKFSFLRDHLGNSNVPYAWFYEKCPSTGTEYLLDSSAALMTAIEAAKFHRPQHIPLEVDYNFTQFNN